MLLSIITPVYNVVSFLSTTIESILSQSYKDFELILVDDGSTDGSSEICDYFAHKDNRVLVFHQKNQGVSAARNKGIELANGDMIGFVDSDDLIEPDMYEQLVSILVDSDVDIVQCGHDRIEATNTTPSGLSSDNVICISGSEFVKRIFTKKGADYTNQVSLCTKIFKKHILNKIHFPVGQTYEDEQETYKACFFANKIALTDTILYHYIKRENSIITGVSPSKLIDKQRSLYDRVKWLPSRIPELEGVCYETFIIYSKDILCRLWNSNHHAEFEYALKLMLNTLKGKKKYLDKYDAIYTYFLKYGLCKSLIMKNNFTPIQNCIRKIK